MGPKGWLWGALLAALAAGSGGCGRGPHEGASTEAPAEPRVLHTFLAEGYGEITILDEDPGTERPSLAVLLVSSTEDALDLPMEHDDGSEITPYEYIAALDPEHLDLVDARILEHHRLETGLTAARALVNGTTTTSAGSCSESAWQTYFNGQAASYGLPAPTHELNRTTSLPTWYRYGNLSTYGRIIAGVCFVSSGDGDDDIRVRMEHRVGGTWSTIPGTTRTLHTTIQGGTRRYIYRAATLCNNNARRIAISGRPPGGVYPADVFHMSGAWAETGCIGTISS